MEAGLRRVAEVFGRLDGVANCVGSLLLKPAHAITVQEWQAMLATNLGSAFAGVDPGNWGSLARAGLTLFEILTLEGWVDLMNTSLAATGWAWIYYVSFVVLAVFVVINLFIAIVINNLEAAKRDEHVATDSSSEELAARFAGIREQLEAIESALRDQAQEGREPAHIVRRQQADHPAGVLCRTGPHSQEDGP